MFSSSLIALALVAPALQTPAAPEETRPAEAAAEAPAEAAGAAPARTQLFSGRSGDPAAGSQAADGGAEPPRQESTPPPFAGRSGEVRGPVVITPPQQIPAIEAPTQPDGASSARFQSSPRVAPVSRVGRDFESRVSAPIRSLVQVRGMEENHVLGIGVVTGLAGTGDTGALATQLLANSLLAQNINIDPALLATSNVAVVRVEGTIPAGAKPGQKIDVRVSSIGDADSLYGGSLTLTELTDISGQVVYATAAGPLTVSGISARSDAATVVKNHLTVGSLQGGGVVQRDVTTSVVSEHGYIYLDAKQGQAAFGNTVRIAETINGLYPDMATMLPDGRTVRLQLMDGVPQNQVIPYLDAALAQHIETENLARVVINERTGVIVMGGEVRLRPGVIHHGTIVVTVAETPEVSQPGPLSQGQTVQVPRSELNVVENNRPMVLLGGATSLEEVVEVLNVLGATPRDMIAILEAMLDGGLLVADLRRL